MKVTTQQNMQHYRMSIGNHENKKNKNNNNASTQEVLNQLSHSQSRKIPDHFCPVTILYASSILSTLSSGENSPQKMPIKVTRNDILSLQRIAQHTVSFIYQTATDGAKILAHYDPLIFPGAAASPQSRPVVSWFRPHTAALIPHKPKFTTPLDSDEVKVEKIDFTCIEERATLSISNVLRKIADTLQYPITEMTRELQVLTYYAQHYPCPTKEEVDRVTEITYDIDKIISQIIEYYPQYTNLQLLQRVIAPVIRMIADDMENKEINNIDIDDINDEILSFSKSIISESIQDDNTFPSEDKLKVPEHVFFNNGNLYVKINDKVWSLSHTNEGFFASKNGVTRLIKYDENENIWRFHDKEMKKNYQESEDPFFTRCTLRHRRGNGLGKLCSSPITEHSATEPQHHPEHSQTSAGSSHSVHPLSPPFTAKQKRVINSIDTGLKESSPRVDKMQFADHWSIYRIRADESFTAGYYHAIKMNGKLVPVRATLIVDNHIHCEVYDLRQSQSGYPVVFYNNEWWFERPTSIHVARSLKENILPSMFVRDIDGYQLSTPDNHGLKRDADHNTYLKINHRFAKVSNAQDNPTLHSANGDRFYLTFADNKYHFTKALLKNEHLAVTAEQFKMDKLMNSADGLDFVHAKKLNDNWTLLNVNVKSSRLIENRIVGSKIDVKFKISHKESNKFSELPELQWGEKIKCKEGNSVWQFSSDMYSHNHNSLTFFSWNNKYAEAYHFAKAEEKDLFHGLVKIYKQDMQPLEPHELPDRFTNEGKIESVKSYLKNNGGVLEITITDVPQIRAEYADINKERVLNFDIGFNDESVAKFNQGISLSESEFEHIFVTTSEDIRLAKGEVNAFAPESVSKKRLLKRRK